MIKRIHVVAAVIENAQQQILLSLRPKHLHQGDLWEFAGGKVESNENVEQALRREIQEELDLQIDMARPLIRIHHDYVDKSILLDVWQVEKWRGTPIGREGQQLAWVKREHLKNYTFPAANLPIITALHLPPTYLITPEPERLNDLSFFHHLERCLDKQINLIQLRAKCLYASSLRDYSYFAERVLTLCDRYHARLLLNADVQTVLSVGANGVHLNSERLAECSARPLPAHLWVAASCHDEQQIQQAKHIQTDFIVISPVQATPSHPDSEPLGWQRFFALTELANCPVYALGGMQKHDIETAFMHGGQGIAAIRSLFNPDNTF